MRITPDTNVLVRIATADNEFQTQTAYAVLNAAGLIALPVATLCELVWVLQKGYKKPALAIARSLRDLLDSEKVETNRLAIEAGLSLLLAGGDFADGAIAYEGRQLGGDVFVTFDKRAAQLISKEGSQAELLPSGH
ncbi:type II toxin-antitoxin system VapC family toxin [Mesorhizobium sp. BAC0120]|uniref:type II toxin-antitoxin system VapC family toxin n=1 Tax=Mesorhizobium sp. BAC0120 TaxID=3090670 RepID=UPI00298D04E8|nr:type II toxin-antitoxin system VapC family toxin [Mesorhizobium sp. BAC0120]MDW6025103.1 type II toxin-antitoxin system VapC family toxin [Mesorhizobium sp. BAC0120]